MFVFVTFANCIEWTCTESIMQIRTGFFYGNTCTVYTDVHTQNTLTLNSEIVQEEFDRQGTLQKCFGYFFWMQDRNAW